MLIVGLTGGIASGKTTVSDAFAELGACVVDTDRGAREVVAPGQPGLKEVADAFGHGILRPDGTLDRARLRELVFRDPPARQRLEAVLHPRIRDWALQRIHQATGPYVILVVPLLVESGALREVVSRVLVVDVPEAVQLARLRQRDGASEAQARSILAAQASRSERLAIADDVLVNDADTDTLRRRVEALHRRYLSLTRNVGDNAGQTR